MARRPSARTGPKFNGVGNRGFFSGSLTTTRRRRPLQSKALQDTGRFRRESNEIHLTLEPLMISQTAEYALRAIVYLADKVDVPQTTQQIAEVTRVPAGYLAKVLQTLGRSGIVRAQRGLHGGFTLAVPPEDLTVLDVVQAVDPVRRIEHCPLGIPDHKSLCPLHARLDATAAMVEKTLGSSTIAELLTISKRGEAPKPFCSSDKKAVSPSVAAQREMDKPGLGDKTG
jgi:Rrf2 family protein